MLSVFVPLVVLTVAAHGQSSKESKTLISFPGARWLENNDPVMGGKSHGNWSVVDANGESFGRFQGAVEDVPFLKAPGFCRAVTISPMMKDASEYWGLVITVRTTTPNYKGFKLSWGTFGAPRHHGGHEIEGSFKTSFQVPASTKGEWREVFLKFSDFSSDWSDFTGDCATKDPDGYQHKCCSKDAVEVCPNATYLRGINSFNVWAEGVKGDFGLDIKEIAAAKAADDELVVQV